MRRVVLPGVLLLVLLTTLSCATVPKSAVKLSDMIGTDLAALKASYISLIEVNYDRMRADIEKFVWEVYAPGAIRAVILDDPADESSLVANMSVAELQRREAEVEGRIKRKLLALTKLCRNQKTRVIIADGRGDNPVIKALEGAGTHIHD